VTIAIYDLNGKMVKLLEDQNLPAGNYETKWKANGLPNGTYIARVLVDGKSAQTVKLTKAE
jgi:flagellar hook assembly protein FlgD